jgi:hypothetical protein
MNAGAAIAAAEVARKRRREVEGLLMDRIIRRFRAALLRFCGRIPILRRTGIRFSAGEPRIPADSEERV